MQGDLSASVLEMFFELTYGQLDGHSVFIGLLFPEVLMLVHEKHDNVLTDDRECAHVVSGLRIYSDATSAIGRAVGGVWVYGGIYRDGYLVHLLQSVRLEEKVKGLIVQ